MLSDSICLLPLINFDSSRGIQLRNFFSRVLSRERCKLKVMNQVMLCKLILALIGVDFFEMGNYLRKCCYTSIMSKQFDKNISDILRVACIWKRPTPIH